MQKLCYRHCLRIVWTDSDVVDDTGSLRQRCWKMPGPVSR